MLWPQAVTPGVTHGAAYHCHLDGRPQREWVWEVREVKSEKMKLSLFFEKCKVKKICFHSFSRSAKWKKMLSLFFEKWKVKLKCFENEIEKWKFSRIPDNSRETRFYNRIIRQGGGGGRLPRWLHPLGVSIDYTRRADDLEEDLDEAEYEDVDDMEGKSEEE